jgi:hypothetical protein
MNQSSIWSTVNMNLEETLETHNDSIENISLF